jgi:hypothetical protein
VYPNKALLMFIDAIPQQGGLISSADGVLLDEGGPQHEEHSGQPLRRCACQHLLLPPRLVLVLLQVCLSLLEVRHL